ncbi:MAG: pantetheine-phosphate adenylyltransferase [Elusimicrobia bacterium]|nr:pantetheine-phosphate adenylyltransferase [Elusimicrobiota bacterium]
MSRLAVYPGSFDPVTRGHLDLIVRTCRLFDRVIVAVSNNPSKKHIFSVNDRIRMLDDNLKGNKQVEVDTFSGLLVDYLHARKAHVIIRGLRAVSDMDYEFQMASMNRSLYPDVETVFLMPDERYTYLSSSMVREVARMGATLDAFVTPSVRQTLKRKYKGQG